MPSVHIVTLGCKVNQCESENLTRQLEQAGYQITDDPARADNFIINSCAVTSRAAMQSRQAVRRLLRQQPQARVLVTGCSVQTDREAFGAIPGVTHLIGNAEKDSIPEVMDGKREPAAIQDWGEISQPPPLRHLSSGSAPAKLIQGKRTRAFFKIQDGCNSFCTYCIVPHARGPVRSMPPGDVMAGLQGYADAGYQEVVLTGIHLGKWGRDLKPPRNLEQLLDHIKKQPPLARVRLSSIEPHELSDGLIECVAACQRFARHFHIPLQSGDNEILKRMGRPYTREQFAERIEKIRQWVPEAGIGVDVMVGFPGENEHAFQQTYDLVQALPITYLHVFPFSPRPGTPAFNFDGQVPSQESKRRAAHLRALGQAKHREFMMTWVGKIVEVLVTGSSAHSPHSMEGLTSNYLKLHFPGDGVHRNRFIKIKVLKLDADDRLVGEIV